jgi:8-oxo-dGTP diphosphatase
MKEDTYRFCPHCSQTLESFDDSGFPRKRCPSCEWVYYRNPTVGVAVILLTEEGLWLGLRRSGGWCIPCGHVEWDETIEQAAVREAKEEMGMEVELHGVFAVLSNFHDPEQHTVGVWFRGSVKNTEAAQAGGDLLELFPYPLDAVPELVFPTDREIVRRLRSDPFKTHSIRR